MVQTLEQFLDYQRQQGQPILPLILQYCDATVRLIFDTCCHIDRDKAVKNCLHHIQAGQIPPDLIPAPMSDEQGLTMLREVLTHLDDQPNPRYRSWLVGVIDSLHEWD